MNRPTPPIHTYNDGKPYRPAAGRNQPREAIEYHRTTAHPIISGFPTTTELIRVIKREMKIRNYAQSSISNYLSCLGSFLRWFGAAPHKIDIEDVRNYLEILVDGGADSSTLSGNLAAIRTCFDKFCGRDITLGLVTPRRKKRQPVILSPAEVSRILGAAPNFTMKLSIGIMYSAGLRNKELCRLKIEDLDFDRNTIRVFQGKGRTDRLVMLPNTFRDALLEISKHRPATAYLFPSLENKGRADRYMSPRTLQRWVKICADLASINKSISPHSFRHAFATHLLENGTDIRFIQKLLGHQRLETTTIYTRVAQIRTQQIASPLDSVVNKTAPNLNPNPPAPPSPQPKSSSPPHPNPVGKLSIKLTPTPDMKSAIVDLTIMGQQPVALPGIKVMQTDCNWLELIVPAMETWRPQLDLLPETQRTRIESPEFYEHLRATICRRFLALKPAPPD